MAFQSSPGYMIFRPEKAGWLEILKLGLFKRRLSDCNFVEMSHETTNLEFENSRTNLLLVGIYLLFLKILLLIEKPSARFIKFLEYTLNLCSAKGGFFNLISHFLSTGSFDKLDTESADYRSIVDLLDGRLNLYDKTTPLIISYPPHVDPMYGPDDIKSYLHLCIMASKIAYENADRIKDTVNNCWKMQFEEFYSCPNAFENDKITQAFIFCDKPEDANQIVVAFRGTETNNWEDWSTDFNFSWIRMGEMGRAHLGFMKALGLQDEKDYQKGWPKDYKGEKDKPLAYYIIREKLKSLLQKHENAKITITGHSLGGALSAIFPSILTLHNETTILNSLSGIVTFGQPRVGDKDFASTVKNQLSSKWYRRVVYRYDLVPRVPFDCPLLDCPCLAYKHSGLCIYFNCWYYEKEVWKLPNKNYFNPLCSPFMHFYAWLDLIMAIYLHIKKDPDFTESWASTAYRLVGLICPGIASHSTTDYVNAVRLCENMHV